MNNKSNNNNNFQINYNNIPRISTNANVNMNLKNVFNNN